MRPWLVVILAAFAILGTSLPVLASDPPPEVTLPGFLGLGDDSLPTNGDENGDVVDEDDADVDEEDDEDDFEEGERMVTVEIDEIEGEVLIELESTDADREDVVNVQFQAPEAELEVSFEMEGSGEEEVEMRIEFTVLVEFEDTDGDGAFSPLDDEVLQEIAVKTLEHAVPDLVPFTVDSTTGQRISVTYALPDGSDGTFELVFWVFGLVTEVDGVPVRPTETKIDIIVTDFPFTATSSLLALGLDVKTEFELEGDGGPTFDQINAVGEEFAAFFQWMPDAVTVDGVAASAEVTTVEERRAVEVDAQEGEFDDELRLFLAYPQGSRIVHDPKVGIVTVALIPEILSPLPSLAAYAAGLGTALLLVLGVWTLNRRRS